MVSLSFKRCANYFWNSSEMQQCLISNIKSVGLNKSFIDNVICICVTHFKDKIILIFWLMYTAIYICPLHIYFDQKPFLKLVKMFLVYSLIIFYNSKYSKYWPTRLIPLNHLSFRIFIFFDVHVDILMYIIIIRKKIPYIHTCRNVYISYTTIHVFIYRRPGTKNT